MESIINDEKWKLIDWIDGLDGKYEISNMGRIRNVNHRKWNVNKRQFVYSEKVYFLTPTDNGNGYKIIGLKVNGKKKNYYMHRLVSIAFVPNPMNKPEVNHINYDRGDNRASNLEWCTDKENTNYSKIHTMHPRSEISGIRFKNGKYEVGVYHGRKQYYCGRFLEYKDALATRNKKLIELGAYDEKHYLR